MSKNLIFKKPSKLKKFAKEISVDGREIKTRMNKKTFQSRADEWDNFFSIRMGGDYADFVNWGAEGGRPRFYDNESEKKQAYRLRNKLKEGRELSPKQIEWLRKKGLDIQKNNKLEKVN